MLIENYKQFDLILLLIRLHRNIIIIIIIIIIMNKKIKIDFKHRAECKK
jgi:hypothetical protein